MEGTVWSLAVLVSTGVAAFAFNLTIIPLILWIAHYRGWYDRNDDRKVHTEDTPRLGGLGIFLAFLIMVVVGSQVVSTATTGSITGRLLPVFVGLTIVFLTGLVDDFRSIPALLKFFLQITAAIVVTLGGFLIDEVALPMGLSTLRFGVFAYPVTVLWIVALVNAMNFIDGLDGLAGGTAAIASFFTAVLGVTLGQPAVAVAGFALFGAVAGFLVFNYPPAKLFMGDSGSYTLGFLLAVLPLLGGGMAATEFGLVPTVTLLFVPILDTLAAILRRMRKGIPVYHPDREHLHHKLLDLGFSTKRVLALVYGAGILSGFAALSWILLPLGARAAIVGTFWVLVITGFLVLHKVSHAETPES